MSERASFEGFDRSRIRFRPVGERTSKFRIEDIAVDPEGELPDPGAERETIARAAEAIRTARARGAPVMLCHGAHLIKNGLGPLLSRLVDEGWLSHVATNGAGSIHDWEFAFQGRSCEDVRAYVSVGEFGIWEETGACLGLALLAGALEDLGYGEAVGRMIHEESLRIPAPGVLRALAREGIESDAAAAERAAAALELLGVLEGGDLDRRIGGEAIPGGGTVEIPHPWKRHSVQSSCHAHGVPFTVHPGIGQDIVYSHPLVRGGALGRAAMIDFLRYAATVDRLEGGVYLSVGSSVMSPMIFEKSLSMSRNLKRQRGETLEDFSIIVNDLARIDWDWSAGEPPVDDPAYYVRFMKSFSRMGGRLSYVGLDNRAFLLNLYALLRERSAVGP